MTSKAEYKEKMLEYLSDPSEDIPTRVYLSVDVLGMANSQALYKMFNLEELEAIEAEALKIRRTKYAPELSKVDRAMLKQAAEGDSKAAKLCYERFEGWNPTKSLTIAPGSDENGNQMKWEVEIVRPEDKKE